MAPPGGRRQLRLQLYINQINQIVNTVGVFCVYPRFVLECYRIGPRRTARVSIKVSEK